MATWFGGGGGAVGGMPHVAAPPVVGGAGAPATFPPYAFPHAGAAFPGAPAAPAPPPAFPAAFASFPFSGAPGPAPAAAAPPGPDGAALAAAGAAASAASAAATVAASLEALPRVTSVFGLLVAGHPVSTAFAELTSGERYATLIPSPGSAEHVSVFLLPGNAFPPGKGITVVAAFPPSFSEYTTLGTLTPTKPSATWRTGWGASAETASAPVALLGLTVAPLDAVTNVEAALTTAEWDRAGFAELVARDLGTFLASLSSPITPASVDRWIAKFREKYRHDPNFLLRRQMS